MFTITTLSLVLFIQKQLDLYFTDSHKVELEKKIDEIIITIENLISDIIKVDPCQKGKFKGWQQNPSTLENSLCQLEEMKQKLVDDKKADEINCLILRLNSVLSDCEKLFLNKLVGLTNWNKNKDYLNYKITCLKSKKLDQILTCDEIISFLNLMPLNEYTSELGYYKEIARGVDEKGKSFTVIFYLLKRNEISYFHKLDVNETWVWLGKSPLSIFIIENGHLINHVLDETNQSIMIPKQTWFSASVKEDKLNLVEDDVSFTLVTCLCVPAFTLRSYHDDITGDEEAITSLINAYKKANLELQTNIIKLLTPEYRGKFLQYVSVSE